MGGPSVRTSVGARAPETLGYLARQAGWAGAIELAGLAARYLFVLVIARLVGAEGLGLYVLAYAFATVLGIAARAGADQALLRFVPYHRARGETGRAVGAVRLALGLSALLGAGAGSLLFVAASAIAATWAEPRLGPAVQVMALAVPLLAVGQVARFGLRGFHDVRVPAALDLVGFPLLGTLAMLLIGSVRPGEPLAPVGATVVASWMVGIAGTALLVRRVSSLHVAPAYEPRAWAAFALPMALEAGLLFLVTQSDRLLLGLLSDATAVGLFDAAVRLALLVALPLTTVNYVVAPAVSSLYGRGDRDALQALYSRFAWATGALGAVAAVSLAMLGPALLGLFGPSFVAAYPALLILLVGQVVNVATGSSGVVLSMTGFVRWRLFNAALTAIVNIGLDLLLIPRWGIVGAAVATTVALVVVNTLQVLEVRRLVGIWVYDPSGLLYWRAFVARRLGRAGAASDGGPRP